MTGHPFHDHKSHVRVWRIAGAWGFELRCVKCGVLVLRSEAEQRRELQQQVERSWRFHVLAITQADETEGSVTPTDPLEEQR